MIVFRWLLPLLAMIMPAFAAVQVSDTTPANSVVAYRGSTTLKTSTGATARYADIAACRAAIEADAEARQATASYRCVDTKNLRVVWSANPPPPSPVDCAVSAWSDWSGGAWSACSAGSQSRSETRSRTITTQPANGGAACPVLSETRTATQACSEPPPPSGDAYPLYPALNLAQIPWHVGAGAWGPQVRLQAPALPVTTRTVTVRSQAEFNAAAAVSGTAITIAQGWAPNTSVTINANDIDVTIPRGVVIGGIELGAFPRTAALARIRIRGEGRMGQYRDYDLVSDVVIDGVDMNGDGQWTGTGEGITVFRLNATRAAVLNVRAVSAGPIWLGDARHVVIANSNLYHGAATRAAVGWAEGWGVRNSSGPLVIVDSRIQGTRYHNLRVHTHSRPGELLYVTRSTLVAAAEGRTTWMWTNLGQGTRGQSGILHDNDIYTYSNCWAGFEIGTTDVDHAAITNNRFYGGGNAVGSQAYLNAAVRGGGAATGNTFAPLVAFPAWSGRGNPLDIPLPAGMTFQNGEGACPGF